MKMACQWRMIVYFSKESRYRNVVTGQEESNPRRKGLVVVGAVVLVLVICFGCLGIIVGFILNGRTVSPPGSMAAAPKATATVDMKAQVPLKAKGLGENGLEVTVTTFQRPLQVQGLTKLAPDQQFVLVSVLVRNTKTTGAATNISPANFQIKGDGGLTYEANPKTVTIDNLMNEQDVIAPGKTLERELIFQIAVDDSGLKMYWTAGKTTRTFLLESQQ
jgi:hypothetical protein